MTKTSTVGEVIKEVEKIGLRVAVYREIQEFLSQFIPTDAFTPSVGIATTITDTGAVSPEVIEEVRDEIEARTGELELEAMKLKGTELKPTKVKKVPPRKAPVRRTRGKAKVKTKKK